MFPEAVLAAPPNARPLWFAAFIAAVSVPVACWVVIIFIEFANHSSFLGEEVMRSLGVLMFFGVPMSLVVMYAVGYPLALTLRHFGKLKALNVCAGGLVIGALFALAGSPYLPAGDIDPQLVLFAGGACLFAGIVFCLVAGIPFRRQTP